MASPQLLSALRSVSWVVGTALRTFLVSSAAMSVRSLQVRPDMVNNIAEIFSTDGSTVESGRVDFSRVIRGGARDSMIAESSCSCRVIRGRRE